MRAMWVLVLGACSPDIASGSYLCGAQELCPPDEACDGVTDTCVFTSAAMPFACGSDTEHAGDDTSATARPIPMLACVSPPYRESGCMPLGDTADWYKLATPASCTAVEVQARLVYPVAYQGLSLELWDLEDPAGRDLQTVRRIRDEVADHVRDLLGELLATDTAA